MLKYFIYCRKSSEEEERQALSIDAQVRELGDFAKRNNLIVVDHFIESMSAKKPGRPIFNEMVERIAKGEAQGIIAWNPDRLARNPVDGGRLIFMLDERELADLKFPTFSFESSTQGKFNLSLAFAQAKHYTDKLSEDIRRGLREKLRRGEFPGKAPVGYINEPRTRTIEPHSTNFAKMKSLLEKVATGLYGLTAVQKEMARVGLVGARTKKAPMLSTIGKILANPIYYGMFEHKGELHQGSHKPMITKETFDKIQAALKTNGKPRSRIGKQQKKSFLFLGFATCGVCGYGITAERHTKKSGLQFIYYRCSHKSKTMRCTERSFVRQEDLAKEIHRNVELVTIPDEWREKFLAKIDVWEAEGSEIAAKKIEEAKAALSSVKTKIARLTDLYLEEVVPLDEFKEKKNPLMQEKADLEQKILKFERAKVNRLEPLKNWILEANQAKNVAISGDELEMKSFLQKVGSNRRLSAKTLSVEFTKPFNSLAEMKKAAPSAAIFSTQTRGWWSRGESNP
jgi:site-specific DNA recombinase